MFVNIALGSDKAINSFPGQSYPQQNPAAYQHSFTAWFTAKSQTYKALTLWRHVPSGEKNIYLINKLTDG